MRKLILILFLLPLLLVAVTTEISDQIGQNEITSPVAKQILVYEDQNGVLVLKNEPYDSLGISTNKIKDADGDTYVDVEQTSDCDSIRFKAGGTYVMSMTSDGTVLEEPLNAGNLQLTADGETMTLADMAVSDTPAAGTDMSAGFKIDANDIFRYGTEADGSGGIQNEYAYINGAFIYGNAVTLADDAELAIKTGVAGFGQVFANDETMHFWFTSAGVLTKISGTANTDVADTDTDLCVYDAGAGISVKNRLGASYKVLIKITYMTP